MTEDWTKEFEEAQAQTPLTLTKIESVIAQIKEGLADYTPPKTFTLVVKPEYYRKWMTLFHFKSKRQWREVRKAFGGDKAKWVAWKESAGDS